MYHNDDENYNNNNEKRNNGEGWHRIQNEENKPKINYKQYETKYDD